MNYSTAHGYHCAPPSKRGHTPIQETARSGTPVAAVQPSRKSGRERRHTPLQGVAPFRGLAPFGGSTPHTINSVHVETARSRQRQSPVTHCLPTAVTLVYIHCRMDMFTHQNDFQKSTLSSLIIMHAVPCMVCWYVSVLSLCMGNRGTVLISVNFIV